MTATSPASVIGRAVSGERTTIGAEQTVRGVGLHMGEPCTLVFRPAASGSGIYFRRDDRPGSAVVPARADVAVAAERRTQLGQGEDAFHTVEHVLSAVGALRIDDLEIGMDGAEPPIMDGSAQPFVEALLRAGLVGNRGRPEWLIVRRPIRVVDGESVYEAHPSASLELDVTIDFPHPMVGVQQGAFRITPELFSRDIAAARTFGFMHEVEALRAKGLIRGASTSNAVVFDEQQVVDGALRWPDELLRHKALDVVGDLVLAASRVRARITAYKPSHRGTVTLVRAIIQQAVRKTPCTQLKTSCRCCRTGIRFCWSIAFLRSKRRSVLSA